MADIPATIRKWLETSSKKQKIIAALTLVGVLATGTLMSMGGASSAANDPLGSTPFYYLSAVVKLMVVLLLIVGTSIVARRWFPFGPIGKTERQMQLIETIRLSPKQALHLVRIGDQQMVIGATDQNVTLIASFDGEPDPVPGSESQPQPGADFASLVRSFDQ